LGLLAGFEVGLLAGLEFVLFEGMEVLFSSKFSFINMFLMF